MTRVNLTDIHFLHNIISDMQNEKKPNKCMFVAERRQTHALTQLRQLVLWRSA
jgi:hypothetical protein